MQQQTVLCIESLENKLLNDSVSIYVKYLHDLATEMYNFSDNPWKSQTFDQTYVIWYQLAWKKLVM